MVDVAVGLVEVAVVVVVVAVPDVEGVELGLHFRRGLARRQLVVGPDGDGVADQRPHAGTDVAAAGVGAIPRLVVAHRHPVDDPAGEAVAPRRLQAVVLEHPGEVHPLEVPPVVVGLPDGDVVLGAVRLGDLVVERAGGAAERAGIVGAEVGQHDEDAVVARLLELDELRSAAPEAIEPLHAAGALPAQPVGLGALLQRLLALPRRMLHVVGASVHCRGRRSGPAPERRQASPANAARTAIAMTCDFMCRLPHAPRAFRLVGAHATGIAWDERSIGPG